MNANKHTTIFKATIFALVLILATPIPALAYHGVDISVNGSTGIYRYDTGTDTYISNTDARYIIQTALDRQSHVILGEGTFIINSNSSVPSLKLHNNNVIEGLGWSTIIKLGDGVWQPEFADYNSTLLINDCLKDGQYVLCTNSNIQIKNLKIDYNTDNQSGLIGQDKGTGIHLQWATNTLIDNVWVTNTNRFGIAIFPGAGSFGLPKYPSEARVTNSRVDETHTYSGYFISNGSNEPVRVILANNFAINNTLAGFHIEDNQGGVTGSNLQAYGNYNGIEFSNARSTIIDNAIVMRNHAGINISGGAYYLILSSIDSEENDYGLDSDKVAMSDSIISDSIFRRNSIDGIRLNGYANDIHDDHIDANGRYGISIKNNNINMNKIHDNWIGTDYTYDHPAVQLWGIYEMNEIISYPNFYQNNIIPFNENFGNIEGAIHLNGTTSKTTGNECIWIDCDNQTFTPTPTSTPPAIDPYIKVISSPAYFPGVASGTYLNASCFNGNLLFSQGTQIGLSTLNGEVSAGNVISYGDFSGVCP